MNILEEFEPLFTGEHKYITDLVGGRSGGRSYHLTLHALHELLYNPDFRGFFVRQIHSTIYSSLWKDFKDRFEQYEEIHGPHPHIQISDNTKGENYAKNILTGATIVTKGFKASSKAQTANLKSLAGGTHLYIEEAEETEYLAFNKLKLSFRKKGVKIKIIRAFNPPPKEHWIWKDYNFNKLNEQQLIDLIDKHSKEDRETITRLVKDPKNKIEALTAEPKDRERHQMIFTTYWNNYNNINEEAINEIEKGKHDDFALYCRTILGLILSGSERSVYQNFKRITLLEYLKKEGSILYGEDFGDRVPNALVEMKFDGENLYIWPRIYVPENQSPLLIELERNAIFKDVVQIADSASPNKIKEIRNAGYSIRAVSKSHDANQAAIKNIRQSNVFYVYDEQFENEYLNFKYAENKTGELLDDQVPDKGDDHFMDAMKYGKIGERYATSVNPKRYVDIVKHLLTEDELKEFLLYLGGENE